MNQVIKVLIVDDDLDIFDITERILRHKGMERFKLSNPREFVASVGLFQPDLILMDIAMHPFDGLHLCIELKKSPDITVALF